MNFYKIAFQLFWCFHPNWMVLKYIVFQVTHLISNKWCTGIMKQQSWQYENFPSKLKIDSSLMFGKFYSYADMCNGCGPLPKNCHTLHVTWWAASLKGQCGGQGHVRGIVKSNPKSLKVTTLRRDRQAGQLPSRLDIRICLRNRNSILKYLCLEGIGSKESRDAVPF